MAHQIERIENDARQIASEARSLTVMASPVEKPGGSLKKNLVRLQARVDNLRSALWRVQRAAEGEIVPFPSEEKAQDDAQPSLVDRVLALLDRRCG